MTGVAYWAADGSIRHCKEERFVLNSVTKEPLKVLIASEEVSSVIDFPYEQLEDVKSVLDRHGIRYWWNEKVISVNNEPGWTRIYISRNSDPKLAQAALDTIA
jgi:hypothetical protein